MRAFHNAATPEDLPGELVPFYSRQEIQEAEVVDCVVQLLNAAVVIRKSHTLKLLTCYMCHVHEGNHLSICPVPHLEDWLAARR